MSPPNDERPAFERLYREHGGLAYIMAMRILGDRQLAEDATQETWIRVNRELERGFFPRFEQSYVLTIARNEALRIATRRGHPPLLAEPLAPEDRDPIEVVEENRILRQALSSLPEGDRQLLELKFVRKTTSEDLRKKYGVTSRNAIWKRVRTAKERLRRALRRL